MCDCRGIYKQDAQKRHLLEFGGVILHSGVMHGMSLNKSNLNWCWNREVNKMQLLNFVGWEQTMWITRIENSIICMLLLIAIREQSCMELYWVLNLTIPVRQSNSESGQCKKKIPKTIPRLLHIQGISG